MSEAKLLEQKILDEAPRLTPESPMKFRCGRDLPCFNCCCSDVNIVLTPYDVLRLRRRLGLGSQEFLAKYAVVPFAKEQRLPIPFIKMRDDEKKTCPWVGPEGCTVYEDRPWPCRMYPVGVASSRTPTRAGEEFFFVLEEPHCKGHGEAKTWTVGEWMKDQGVAQYNSHGELFKELTLHPRLVDPKRELDPRQIELYFMATYDLDRFRRFVFESKFLETFEVARDYAEKLRSDDEELLTFGLQWLRYVLCGDHTAAIKPEVLAARQPQAVQP